MKISLITEVIAVLATSILTPQVCSGQGTVYLSNIDQTPIGGFSVGSDSWYAIGFSVGTNSAGYILNSFQLRMLGASGSPADFTVLLYTNRWPPVAAYPDYAIAQFTGSTDPAVPGIYTYVPDSVITLSRNGSYFIVATAGTPVANGAYNWSASSNFVANPAQGWYGGGTLHSPDGFSWAYSPTSFAQFAVNADRVPEPTALLLSVGGGILVATCLQRRKGNLR